MNITGGAISGERKGIAVCGDSAFGYWDGTTKQYQDGAVTTLNISGGFVTCENDSPICTLGDANYTSAVINITGGVIYRANTQNGTPMPAIYAPSTTLTISGGYIIGPTAVEIRGGKVEISGGTLVSDAEGDASDDNNSNDGAKTYGYAVAVYPYGKVTRDGAHTDVNITEVLETDNEVVVNITGGTFYGTIYVRAKAERANWSYAVDYSVTIAVELGFDGTSYGANGETTTDGNEVVYTVYGIAESGDDGDGTGNGMVASVYVDFSDESSYSWIETTSVNYTKTSGGVETTTTYDNAINGESTATTSSDGLITVVGTSTPASNEPMRVESGYLTTAGKTQSAGRYIAVNLGEEYIGNYVTITVEFSSGKDNESRDLILSTVKSTTSALGSGSETLADNVLDYASSSSTSDRVTFTFTMEITSATTLYLTCSANIRIYTVSVEITTEAPADTSVSA